jgi:hypothetical protein
MHSQDTTDDRDFYLDSESPVIQYGSSEEEIITTYPDENQPTNTANTTDPFVRRAKIYLANSNVVPRRAPRGETLLSDRCKLLELANSAAMVTGGSDRPSPLQTHLVEPPMPTNTVVELDVPDGSETQNPSQQVQLPAVESQNTSDLQPSQEAESQILIPFGQPPDSETQISSLVMEFTQLDDSETQIPFQFIPQPVAPLPTLPATTTKKSRGRPRSTVPFVTSTPSVRLPDMWCHCPDIYPDAVEIVTALQDPGKQVFKIVNGTRQPVTTFPLIQKICTKIYQQIQAVYKPEGLTKNITRGRESLASLVLMSRKLTDAMNLDLFFHPFAKNGQVYTITNSSTHCGLDIPIKEFQATIVDQIKRAKSTRTCNDGLRLALTLLDPRYRDATSIVMSNRKDRIHSDINGDHVLHLFEQVLEESFKNPSYHPPTPDNSLFGDIDDEEVAQWDPNDPKIFEVDRDASWLMDTWKVYIKRKYKTALDRWNKETGGGNGQSWSFINYCDKDARWLVVVFLRDVEANYLLASNAGGRMPTHLQMECTIVGPQELSSLDSSTSNQQQRKKRAMIDAEKETKQLKSDISSVVTMISCMYKERQDSKKVSGHNEEYTNSKEVLADINELNQSINDKTSIDSMPAGAREEYVLALNEKRTRLISKMLELVRKEGS